MYRTLQVALFRSAFLLRRLHAQLFPVVPHCSGTGPERFPGRVCSYGATFLAGSTMRPARKASSPVATRNGMFVTRLYLQPRTCRAHFVIYLPHFEAMTRHDAGRLPPTGRNIYTNVTWFGR